MAKKIFIMSCALIFLSVILTGCSLTPRTVDQFITNYNREIGNAMKHHVEERELDSYVTRCSLNPGSKTFKGVQATFKGYGEPKLAFMFHFDEDISAKELFGMIDAAILAVGDDDKEVDTALGILKGTNYNINGGYQNNITFNGKEYFIEWVGGYISFMIILSN